VNPAVDLVVKLGGGVLAHVEHFDSALAAIGEAARRHRLLVVPGGGPFADVVREVARQHRLTDSAAHWMAILAMDQYAHLVASRMPASVLVTGPREIADALDRSQVPVLAPARWLREADPLPHSWDVTSDSIAAWVAGQVGARRLVLIKPPGASGESLLDPYFAQALPAHVTAIALPVDQLRASLFSGT
jgi:aspartokinase-like uncharacterized kinase